MDMVHHEHTCTLCRPWCMGRHDGAGCRRERAGGCQSPCRRGAVGQPHSQRRAPRSCEASTAPPIQSTSPPCTTRGGLPSLSSSPHEWRCHSPQKQQLNPPGVAAGAPTTAVRASLRPTLHDITRTHPSRPTPHASVATRPTACARARSRHPTSPPSRDSTHPPHPYLPGTTRGRSWG